MSLKAILPRIIEGTTIFVKAALRAKAVNPNSRAAVLVVAGAVAILQHYGLPLPPDNRLIGN